MTVIWYAEVNKASKIAQLFKSRILGFVQLQGTKQTSEYVRLLEYDSLMLSDRLVADKATG